MSARGHTSLHHCLHGVPSAADCERCKEARDEAREAGATASADPSKTEADCPHRYGTQEWYAWQGAFARVRRPKNAEVER